MELNVSRNCMAYWGQGEGGGGGGMEMGEEEDYIPVTTLSPPKCLLH